MARGKTREYGDDALVEMPASGKHTSAETARAVGPTGTYVRRAARGERRLYVHARLEGAQQARLDEDSALAGPPEGKGRTPSKDGGPTAGKDPIAPAAQALDIERLARSNGVPKG